MSKEQFELAAYHESGHILMAYLCGFSVDEVRLSIESPGDGFTRFNYGDDRITLLIAGMKNYETSPSLFNELNEEIKKHAGAVSNKYIGVLLGGPLSQAFKEVGIGFQGNLPVEMSGPDLISADNVDLCLSNVVAGHDPNFIQKNFIQVAKIFQSEGFWDGIEHLANSILESDEKSLSKTDIEKSLQDSGFAEKFLS